MGFQSETFVFKFLWCSVDVGAILNPVAHCILSMRQIRVFIVPMDQFFFHFH